MWSSSKEYSRDHFDRSAAAAPHSLTFQSSFSGPSNDRSIIINCGDSAVLYFLSGSSNKSQTHLVATLGKIACVSECVTNSFS